MRTIAVTIFVSALAAAGTVDATVLFPKGQASLQRHHERQVEWATEQVYRSLTNTKWHDQVHRTLAALTTSQRFVLPQTALQHQDGITLLLTKALHPASATITWRIKKGKKIPSVVAEASSFDRFELGPHVADLLTAAPTSSLQRYFTTTVVHFERRTDKHYVAPSLQHGAAAAELSLAARDATIAAKLAEISMGPHGGLPAVQFFDSASQMVVTNATNGGPPIRVSDNGVIFGLSADHAWLSIATRQRAAEPPLPSLNE